MGSGHRRHIESIWPELDTVCEIKQYLRPGSGAYEYGDILDPIGMGRDVYQDVFDEIDGEICRVVDHIVRGSHRINMGTNSVVDRSTW